MPIDTEAQFTDVYRAHYEDVLRFVRRRAHPMNVDDIVGETFLAAWRRRRELPENPRPWLFGAARNVMLNANRGMRRQAALVVHIQQAAATADVDDPAVDATAEVDSRIDLVAAWRSLPRPIRKSSRCTSGRNSTPATRQRSSAAPAPPTPCV
jgi:RNA polymerase sigma-70 factor (ECF subfamily)